MVEGLGARHLTPSGPNPSELTLEIVSYEAEGRRARVQMLCITRRGGRTVCASIGSDMANPKRPNDEPANRTLMEPDMPTDLGVRFPHIKGTCSRGFVSCFSCSLSITANKNADLHGDSENVAKLQDLENADFEQQSSTFCTFLYS